jgi:AcrR family transcriptional regulator
MVTKPTQDERIKTASQKRRERQKAETRAAIIEAATELFLSQGYAGFSLRQVAEQIGYSPGTIYLYFDSKDDLLFYIVDEGFRKFGEMLQAAVDASDDPRQQLDGMFDGYINFGLENPVHYRLMFMEHPEFMTRESQTAPIGDSWSETFMILHRTVQRCIDAGMIEGDDALSLSDALWAGVHGIVSLAIVHPIVDHERIRAGARDLIGMLQRGMDPVT